MSEKKRHDKDGHDQNKANQAMHEHEKTGAIPSEGRHLSDSEKRDAMDRADFDKDLRPHEFEGNNSGTDDPQPNLRQAYDIKELHEKYPQFSSTDLKNLTILPEGTRLEQGAKYFDLNHPQGGELAARADMTASQGTLYVAKNTVDYELWNRLCGQNPTPSDS